MSHFGGLQYDIQSLLDPTCKEIYPALLYQPQLAFRMPVRVRKKIQLMETTHYVNWNNYLINRERITILRVTKCKPISFNTVISSVLDLLCGPDGLSHEMYSTFKDTLSPLLTNIFFKNVSIKKLTQSLQLTTIKIILKKNKDPDDPRHIGPLKFEH